MNRGRIDICGITKTYDKNVVLHIDECQLEMNRVYGLVGTNGAGKTTLLEIIAGTVLPDEGSVDIGDLYLEMVHHDIGLFQEMTVYENMFLNRELYHNKLFLKSFDWKRIKMETMVILKEYELVIDIEKPVRDLSASTQKLLEIVIALSKNPDILIIDEPLSLLDVEQVIYLNGLIERFMIKEKMVIYSSHRLDELFRVVDSVITMRNSQLLSIVKADETVMTGLFEFSEKDMHKYPKRHVTIGDPILEVDNLVTEYINGINFDLSSGEILGIVGLKGSSKSNIGKALFGAIPSEDRIRIEGAVMRIRTTTQAVESGICYLGSDNEGMFVEDTLINNVVSANVPRARRLSRSAKRLISKYYLDMLNISGDQGDMSLKNMSAGNKQKVLLAKWFFSKSKVFIFNKPTANIDVPSKVDIYNIFSDLAESGAGIIVISNDLEEVAGICDRVLVIKSGDIAMELEREALTVHEMVKVLQNW